LIRDIFSRKAWEKQRLDSQETKTKGYEKESKIKRCRC
jgi:hypothetical protein